MYKQNLFNVIKLLALATILVELATLKLILTPSCYLEFVHIHALIWVYTEHIILSIAFLGLGALIFIRFA